MPTEPPSPHFPTESDSSSSSGRPRFTPLDIKDSNSSLSLQGKFSSRETALADFPPLCDERLHKFDILTWTSVAIPSLAAKRALSLYLGTDHTTTALFDVDLFLDDLVSGGTRFCSRLLVSSLLSWACVRCIFSSKNGRQTYT